MLHDRRTDAEIVYDRQGRLCVAVTVVQRYSYGTTGNVRRLHPVGSRAEAARYMDEIRQRRKR